MKLTRDQRERFDRAMEEVVRELPEELVRCFDEIPLIAEDRPSQSMMRRLGIGRPEFLRGLHTGIPLTRRSVEHSGVLPTVITIYRLGILMAATDKHGRLSERALQGDIRKTILHELGHHFGFGEDELRRYGY